MEQINEVVTLDIEDGIAVLTLDSPPVNALSAAVREGLKGGITAANAEDEAQAYMKAIGQGSVLLIGQVDGSRAQEVRDIYGRHDPVRTS
mgnify:CR=1 FL=1